MIKIPQSGWSHQRVSFTHIYTNFKVEVSQDAPQKMDVFKKQPVSNVCIYVYIYTRIYTYFKGLSGGLFAEGFHLKLHGFMNSLFKINVCISILI